MISQLHIENIAVIEAMDIMFAGGLNLLTGETGAGKSVVIDALGAALGGRVTRDLVRRGADSACVTALFWNPGDAAEKFVSENFGVECEGEILLGREIFAADGRTVCRVCGKPATVAQLRELGGLLVRVHGQHDSKMLLDENAHIDFLDKYAGCADISNDYREKYGLWRGTAAELKRLISDDGDKDRRADLLRYQIEEIEGAALVPGEDDALNKRRVVLKNAQKITAAVEEAYASVFGDDDSAGAVDLLGQTRDALASVAGVSEELGDISARLDETLFDISDIAEEIRAVREVFSQGSDPEEGADIERRLDQIYRLRKYGAGVDAILEFHQKIRAELDGIEHQDERIAALTKLAEERLALVEKSAEKLTKTRQAAAEKLQKALESELRELDMERVKIAAEFSKCDLAAGGAETMRFMISANVGEPLKPLSKVASGGELARVMLAMMNVLSDETPTMVFDEVDAGISGSAAVKVAKKLKKLSKDRQVLCVTHLPQIAAAADTHFHIDKTARDGRTYTEIASLDSGQRVLEIAKIIGNLSDSTKKSALEMMQEYKK